MKHEHRDEMDETNDARKDPRDRAIDDALGQALRAEDPGAAFTQRVLAKAREERAAQQAGRPMHAAGSGLIAPARVSAAEVSAQESAAAATATATDASRSTSASTSSASSTSSTSSTSATWAASATAPTAEVADGAEAAVIAMLPTPRVDARTPATSATSTTAATAEVADGAEAAVIAMPAIPRLDARAPRARTTRLTATRKLIAAIAASLTLAAAGAQWMQHRRYVTEGERARAQVLAALRLTNDKLNIVHDQITEREYAR